MDILQQLAVALGLSTLAGINLYLTVFVTGLAINQQWISLAPQYESLAILGHPAILILAGVLYFCEFFADKVPWFDSAWDAVHTAIRPIGAALVSIQVLGEASPLMDVVAGLLGGSVALTTHTAKSATRLLVNTSPEPVSNVIVSVSEDVAVVGGLSLLYLHPAIGVSVCLAFVLLTLWLFPKFWRSTNVTLHLLFRKIGMGTEDKGVPLAKLRLPARYESHFAPMNPHLEELRWCAPVITRRGPGLPRNLRGYLVATHADSDQLFFLARTGFKGVLKPVPLAKARVRHESRFLIEEVHLFASGHKRHYIFGLDRSRQALALELARSIEIMIEEMPVAVVEAETLEEVTAGQLENGSRSGNGHHPRPAES